MEHCLQRTLSALPLESPPLLCTCKLETVSDGMLVQRDHPKHNGVSEMTNDHSKVWALPLQLFLVRYQRKFLTSLVILHETRSKYLASYSVITRTGFTGPVVAWTSTCRCFPPHSTKNRKLHLISESLPSYSNSVF